MLYRFAQTCFLFTLLALLPRLAALEPLPAQLNPAEGAPVLFLNPGQSENAPANTVLCLLKATSPGGGEVSRGADTLVFQNKGHVRSEQAMTFTLAEPAAGRYTLWVNFSLGGVSPQTFTVRCGAGGESSPRLSDSLTNPGSWQGGWQKADGAFLLLPGENEVTIQVNGMASDRKIFSGFLLVAQERFPASFSEQSGKLRSDLLALGAPQAPQQEMYLLDADEPRAGDPLCAALLATLRDGRLNDCRIRYFAGKAAQEMQLALKLPARPALVLLGNDLIVRGILLHHTPEALTAFLKHPAIPASIANAPAPAATETPQPMAQGYAAEWLVCGFWAGPAGLSLNGIETEPRIRPNRSDPVNLLSFDSAKLDKWDARTLNDQRSYVIEESSRDYVWPGSAAYAALYVQAEQDRTVTLDFSHTGEQTALWLNGLPIESAAAHADKDRKKTKAVGITDQRNKIETEIFVGRRGGKAELRLNKGWNRLLVKFLMRPRAGDNVSFTAQFLEQDGQPALRLTSQLTDPDSSFMHGNLQAVLSPRWAVSGIADLARPGEPLALTLQPRYFPDRYIDGAPVPFVPFTGRWKVTLTDYDGKEVAARTVDARVPDAVRFDFGSTPETGYYSMQATLTSSEGQLLATLLPDGFSVISGTAAQNERKLTKKLATTYYFMGNARDACMNNGGADFAFSWMSRIGIYRNVGSSPGFPQTLWEKAKTAGILLCTDFWDIHNNETAQQKQELARKTAVYGPWYKSFNEIDISKHTKGTPAQWVERTRWEYEAAHAARPDAVYMGGSLVRVGTDEWFTECLKLGLDRYHDVWDVHVYPKVAPVLGGMIGNSPNECDAGVLNSYKKLGRINRLPFWIGETGARASHGTDARRWQAETVTKMIACAGSRSDIQVIAFLIPWKYSVNAPVPAKAGDFNAAAEGTGDIQTGHHPAEAAYYTAGALIDGLPYRQVNTTDANVQAGYFGPTLLLWSTWGVRDWEIRLPEGVDHVLVDVVGRHVPLSVQDGIAKIRLTQSPVYILPAAEYARLTRF